MKLSMGSGLPSHDVPPLHWGPVALCFVLCCGVSQIKSPLVLQCASAWQLLPP